MRGVRRFWASEREKPGKGEKQSLVKSISTGYSQCVGPQRSSKHRPSPRATVGGSPKVSMRCTAGGLQYSMNNPRKVHYVL